MMEETPVSGQMEKSPWLFRLCCFLLCKGRLSRVGLLQSMTSFMKCLKTKVGSRWQADITDVPKGSCCFLSCKLHS